VLRRAVERASAVGRRATGDPPTALVAAVVAVLVVLTIAVRAPDAVREALWADEVGSARTITAPSTRAALTRIRRESSPPAWFFGGRVVYKVGSKLADFGGPSFLASMSMVRLFSVLFSAIATALVFVWARRMLPFWAAAVAGLGAAVAYQLVLHGWELRAYALLTLFAVVFPLLLEDAARDPGRRRLVVLAVVVLLGSFTHYFFLLVVFSGLVWLWVVWKANRLRVTAAIAIGLLPLLAWLPVTLFQASRVSGYFGPFDRNAVVYVYARELAGGPVWRYMGATGEVATLVLVLVGAALLFKRPAGRLAAIQSVLPVGVTALVWALGLHIFDNRNLLIVVPPALIALAAIPSSLPSRTAAALAGLALAGMLVWVYLQDRPLGRTPYNRMADAAVAMGWSARDPVLFFGVYPESKPLGWHLPGHPRLLLDDPGPGTCGALYAVVLGPTGRDWLTAHDDTILTTRRFPWYGNRLQGVRRDPDAAVARLRFSPSLLRSAAREANLFHADSVPRPPCLAPHRRPSG
jgi:hypothetical protein